MLAIAIAGILGGSIVNTILALSVVGWAKYARLVRSMTLKVRGEEYVTAAVMMGPLRGQFYVVILSLIFCPSL